MERCDLAVERKHRLGSGNPLFRLEFQDRRHLGLILVLRPDRIRTVRGFSVAARDNDVASVHIREVEYVESCGHYRYPYLIAKVRVIYKSTLVFERLAGKALDGFQGLLELSHGEVLSGADNVDEKSGGTLKVTVIKQRRLFPSAGLEVYHAFVPGIYRYEFHFF